MEKHHAHSKHADKKDEAEDSGSKSTKYLIIGVAIIAIILLSTMVLSKYVFKNTNKVEYNHYVFEKFEGNKWMTQQSIRGQLYSIPFYNNPTEVLDIPVDPNATLRVRSFSSNPNGTLYISVDPYESSKVVIAGVEYARILGTAYNIYNINVKSAISEPVDLVNGDGPKIITCQDASRDVFVIQQKVTGRNVVSLVNPNCILIESKDVNESIRVADAFTFRLLSIIQDNNPISATN